MRVTSLAIALAATLALPAVATAQSGFPPKPYPVTTTDNAGNPPPGSYTAQGQVTNRGPRTTTGQGYSGSAGPAPMRKYHHRRSHRMMER